MSVQMYNANTYFLSIRDSLVDQLKTPSFMEILCGAKEVKCKTEEILSICMSKAGANMQSN